MGTRLPAGEGILRVILSGVPACLDGAKNLFQ